MFSGNFVILDKTISVMYSLVDDPAYSDDRKPFLTYKGKIYGCQFPEILQNIDMEYRMVIK